MLMASLLCHLSIVATSPTDPTAPSQDNNTGASFFFYVETAATDLDILTDGTDKFVGAAMVAVDDGAKKRLFQQALTMSSP
jgi:hypothetical protein